ncbi:MAG: glycosyltransferase [Syntrophothermus sp.]
MERLRILVSGMLAGVPHQGGASWAALQYVAGLRSLGHEVIAVEAVPRDALRRGGEVVRYFRSLPLLGEQAALLAADGAETVGLELSRLEAFARGADLLLNLSGSLREERLLEPVAVRAFLDLDPGFNQAWAAAGEDLGLDLHTHFATVGSRIGHPDCPIPTLGRNWIETLPPVALEHWPGTAAARGGAFTTVGHWRSYGSIEHGGIRYGQRAHSWRRLIDLPRRTSARLRPALAIDRGEVPDLRALRANGWDLVDPARVASTPGSYADFVRASAAELCVAKSGYVDSRSGWFSDRSAAYLASGRPVVAQDTGFSERLPTGEGLLAFADAAEAAAAIAAIAADPDRHRAAARELAEEHLDARVVLSSLLERLGAARGAAR